MAIYRAQIGFPIDSAFPRDIVTINPHYQGDNAQALADQLKANLMASAEVGASGIFRVKIYDAEKAPPSYPIAEASNGVGFMATNSPREMALCLSFYSTYNRPSYRGRLYIPVHFMAPPYGLRPTPAQQQHAMNFADILGKNLPLQHTWSVWSPKLKRAWTINHTWVDDEWDTVRSRGLKAENRMVGTIP